MKYTCIALGTTIYLLCILNTAFAENAEVMPVEVQVETIETTEMQHTNTSTETQDAHNIASNQTNEMAVVSNLPGAAPVSEITAMTNGVVSTQQEESKGTVYTVQLGAFTSRERAFALYWDLSKKISPLQVAAPNGDDLFRVRYGSFPNKKEAQDAVEKIRKKGVQCFVTAVK